MRQRPEERKREVAGKRGVRERARAREGVESVRVCMCVCVCMYTEGKGEKERDHLSKRGPLRLCVAHIDADGARDVALLEHDPRVSL